MERLCTLTHTHTQIHTHTHTVSHTADFQGGQYTGDLVCSPAVCVCWSGACGGVAASQNLILLSQEDRTGQSGIWRNVGSMFRYQLKCLTNMVRSSTKLLFMSYYSNNKTNNEQRGNYKIVRI